MVNVKQLFKWKGCWEQLTITYSFTLKGCLQCSCPFPHTRPACALLYSVSAHCSNPHSTFRDKLHSKPHTYRLCSLWLRAERRALSLMYTVCLHMIMHRHALSTLLVFFTWCCIYQPCICIAYILLITIREFMWPWVNCLWGADYEDLLFIMSALLTE